MLPIKKFTKITYRHGDWTFYGARHRGIDFVAPKGMPVYATEDGYVEERATTVVGNAAYLYAYDGTLRRYLHLNEPPIEGQIKKGDIIGYSGNTGLSTAPHLHYDVYNGHNFNVYNFENFIDPESMQKLTIYQVRGEDAKYSAYFNHQMQKAIDYLSPYVEVTGEGEATMHLYTLNSRDHKRVANGVAYNDGSANSSTRKADEPRNISIFIGDSGHELWYVIVHEILHHLRDEIMGNDMHTQGVGWLDMNDWAFQQFKENYDPLKHLINKFTIKTMAKEQLTKEEVINQYILTRRYMPSYEEVNYWEGKRLVDMQNVMMRDDKNLLESKIV